MQEAFMSAFMPGLGVTIFIARKVIPSIIMVAATEQSIYNVWQVAGHL
jgi:hypothetical protein